jgi:hypothetical protein
MSSAILYGAIVVIWAGVLIPRWLRRESSVEEAPVVTELTDVAVPEPSPVAPPEPVKEERPVRRGSEKARVIAARRRLLGMLVLLAIGAGVLAVMELAAWWVVLPPTVMLVAYLLLLREASRADAEKRVAASATAPAARERVAPRAPVVAPAPVVADAEVIDITGRVNEEFFDQYADAKLRAVGD